MVERAVLSIVGIISIVCASYIVEYILHWLRINNNTYKPIQIRKSDEILKKKYHDCA